MLLTIMQPLDPPLQWSCGSTLHTTERGYWWRYDIGLTPTWLFVQTQVHGVESENAPRVLHLAVNAININIYRLLCLLCEL